MGGEGVQEVLFVILLDVGRERFEDGEDVICYGERELPGRLDVGGEGNAVELGGTADVFSCVLVVGLGLEQSLTCWRHTQPPRWNMEVLMHLSCLWPRTHPLSQSCPR